MSLPAVYVYFGIGATAVECEVLSAKIHHGRDDPTSQPEPSSATFEILGPLPLETAIGALVVIVADMGGTLVPRFRGEITDINVGWETVDLARPQIVAVGKLGRLGRRMVGAAPWLAELDGVRVGRIVTEAGYSLSSGMDDPGTVTVLPRDVDKQDALELARSTANDGGGILWQDCDGQIGYADALHRRGNVIAHTFEACDIGMGLGWTQTLEGLINSAVLRYGYTPVDGEQPAVESENAASIDVRGEYAVSLTTQIEGVSDAQSRADQMVVRGAEPAWVLSGLSVDLGHLSDVDIAAVLALEIHDLVNVSGLPPESPATDASLWVEGWQETIEGVPGGGLAWQIEFATSDYCRTSAPPQWDELPASETWDSIDPLRTWDRAHCLPPGG